MKKILFVSHDASRTGAPIMLLNFLEWLKKENVLDYEVFLTRRGPLEFSFKALAITHSLSDNNLFSNDNLLKRLLRKIKRNFFRKPQLLELPNTLKNKKFDLIYLNTVDTLNFSTVLKSTFNCPVICHIHENNYTIRNYYFEKIQPKYTQNINHFIAVSKSTMYNLIENYNIPKEKISLIYEGISLAKMKTPTKSRELILEELGFGGDFVVGGSGLTLWRKGVDLFVQIAFLLNKIAPNNKVKLLWIGCLSDEFRHQFEYESERLGVTDKIVFAGEKLDPQNYFQVFDVFALTSREDPFPLVALEVAAQKKTIIFFNNSGGIGELFENGNSGFSVNYGDVTEIATLILSLEKDRNKMIEVGERAADLVKQFDVSLQGLELLTVIESLLC